MLFEMLTARRPFAGDEISDTLAFIITKEPDWSALPADTPAAIRRLIRRCLDKDRAHRLQHIGDARLDIDEAMAPAALTESAAAPGLKTGHSKVGSAYAWVAAISAIAFVAAAALAAVLYLQRAPADARTLRFSVSPPDGWSVTSGTGPTGGAIGQLAVSPDGRRVAILARNAEGRDRLFVRALDSLAAQELAGTDGANGPFWSPDGRSLGFFAGGKLKKIDVSGGPPVTVCDTPEFRGGTWSRDGVIVFASMPGAGLYKVPASGGVPTAATVLGQGEVTHFRPTFLPDGRHFVYRVPKGGIYIASLDSADRTLLIKSPDASNVVFTEDHLLFLSETTLMAQPFDMRRLALMGEPIPIADQIQTNGNPPVGVFSASDSGVLAYQTGKAAGGAQLTWFDRTGKPGAVVGDRAVYSDLTLSPDGKRAAVSVSDQGLDIWLVDLARSLRTRFTFDPANEFALAWSPDGTRIVFGSRRKGPLDLYQKASSGAGTEDVLLADSVDKSPWSWSPDGRFILYSAFVGGTTGSDLWILPLFGDRKPSPFLQTRFNENHGQFSSDGRWVAYVSDEAGQNQVLVAPFPGPGGKWQISTGGGSFPRWRRDGKEIFYLAADNKLMSAAVNAQGSGFEVGAVRPLFTVRPGGARYFYDVAPDGQRFLVNTLAEQTTASPITVVVNWMAALKK